jgi:hypothetical protein
MSDENTTNKTFDDVIEIQKQLDKEEREIKAEAKRQETLRLIKLQQEEEDKIEEEQIIAYDNFMNMLSQEDIDDSFARPKPDLEDFTTDTSGRILSHERSVVRKPADAVLDLTQEHISEMNFCFRHPIYTIKNYFKIVSPDKGLTNFKLYKYQAQYIKDCFAHKRQISCWSRQSGKCFFYKSLISLAKTPESKLKKFIYRILKNFLPSLITVKFID